MSQDNNENLEVKTSEVEQVEIIEENDLNAKKESKLRKLKKLSSENTNTSLIIGVMGIALILGIIVGYNEVKTIDIYHYSSQKTISYNIFEAKTTYISQKGQEAKYETVYDGKEFKTSQSGKYRVGKDIEPGNYDIVGVLGNGNLFGYSYTGNLILNELIAGPNDYSDMYIQRYDNYEAVEGDEIQTSGVSVKFVPHSEKVLVSEATKDISTTEKVEKIENVIKCYQDEITIDCTKLKKYDELLKDLDNATPIQNTENISIEFASFKNNVENYSNMNSQDIYNEISCKINDVVSDCNKISKEIYNNLVEKAKVYEVEKVKAKDIK